MKKSLVICFCILIGLSESGFAQLPISDQGYFYYYTTSCGVLYRKADSFTTVGQASYLPGATGLAIGPSFGFPAPNPTFWQIGSNGNYYYFNGTTYVNSGHSAGGASFINPTGSQNYLYNINANGEISVYDGTANATILTTLSGFTSSDAVQDIAADKNDNFYLLKYSSPQSLSVFNSAGVLTCSYNVTGLPNGSGIIGLSISGRKVQALQGANFYSGSINGDAVDFSYFGTHCSGLDDMANAPSESILAPAVITALDTISCFVPTTIITTPNDLGGTNTYAWMGPGIVGATTNHSIVVNAPGVYSRSVTNCAGITDTSSIRIALDVSPKPLYPTQSALIKCKLDQPVELSVTGLGNYSWTPSSSLSSSVGALVYATPSITTTYTVSGNYNGCPGSTVITIAANLLTIVPTAASPSLCIGDSNLLNANGSLQYTWEPGNYSGSLITVSPAITTCYTVSASDNLGCSESNTIIIAVKPLPVISIASSNSVSCAGEPLTLYVEGADQYNWNTNESSSSISISPIITSVYNVTGTSTEGCSSSVSFTQLVSECTGIKKYNELSTIQLYPNPSSGEFNLRMDAAYENSYIEIYNTTGQLIIKQEVHAGDQAFDLKNKAEGLYFIKVTTQNTVLFQSRLIIK